MTHTVLDYRGEAEIATKFKDYVQKLEQDLSPDGRAALDSFREHYDLAHQVIELRREQHLTQVALAERSGIPQSEISRIESGRANPTVATLQALAHALGARLSLVRS